MQDVEKLKVVIIGDRGVGKRTLLSSGFGKSARASPFYIPIEFNEVVVKGKSKVYNVTCFDSLVNTAMVAQTDAPLVNDFISTVVDGADALVFCYSADSPSSLRNLSLWFKDIFLNLTANAMLYLVETKGDLPRRVGDSELKDFKATIKFNEHFRINALNKNDCLRVFTSIVDQADSLRVLNKSQLFDKNVTNSRSYISPEKRTSAGQSQIRYSDSKEKIILMEGSYSKKMTVVDESKAGVERSVRIESKTILDKEPELEDF